MSLHRWGAVLVVFAIVAAACGDGDPSPLSVDDYVAAMQEVAGDFLAETRNGSPADGDGYPLGGDLVPATELYTRYDGVLASWRSIAPPEEVARLHAELVEALRVLQEKVGDYLMDEALDSGAIDFDDIGVMVAAELSAATAACRELDSALGLNAGAGVFGSCEF